jgi:hypothetical protein
MKRPRGQSPRLRQRFEALASERHISSMALSGSSNENYTRKLISIAMLEAIGLLPIGQPPQLLSNSRAN